MTTWVRSRSRPVSPQRRKGETAASLLERADAALYDSKRKGRNCITAAPADRTGDATSRLTRPSFLP